MEPEKSLIRFVCFLHFSHSCPQTCTIIRLFGQGLSCILSCISPKKPPFLPQNGRFRFFSYLHCFLLVYQCFLHKHRSKSADKPACISLGYHHITFSKINSKCDRAFVAPPEFKSLMLRQSTVQCAFFERSVPLFYAKSRIFEFDNFITGEKTPCFGEKSHFFKCHFPDLNPFQARSALLLLKKPWKRSPNANKYSRW